MAASPTFPATTGTSCGATSSRTRSSRTERSRRSAALVAPNCGAIGRRETRTNSRTMSRTMLRKLIPAVAVLALVAGPAAAQVALSPFKHQERKLTPDEIAKQKADDAAYKA